MLLLGGHNGPLRFARVNILTHTFAFSTEWEMMLRQSQVTRKSLGTQLLVGYQSYATKLCYLKVAQLPQLMLHWLWNIIYSENEEKKNVLSALPLVFGQPCFETLPKSRFCLHGSKWTGSYFAFKRYPDSTLTPPSTSFLFKSWKEAL